MTFHESVVQALDEAGAGGADEAQLAILNAALTTDAIAFEDAQQALYDYRDCLEGSGLALVGLKVVDDGGFKRFDYGVSLGEADVADANGAVADACYAKTYQWVDMLYQTQPAGMRAQDAKFDAALPALIACLKDVGVPVDEKSPADEVKQAMLAFMNEHRPKGDDDWPAAEEAEYERVGDCLQSVGLDGF